LVEGWALDGCTPYFGTPGFPFKDDDHRQRLWEEHREELVRRWGPVERMAAWRDYDATPKQRRAFDVEKRPQVWAWRSQHGDGDPAAPKKIHIAEVIPMEATDGD